jgi:peptidylamidoglycolate lyase
VDRNGQVIEEWKQWYDRFRVPHRITMDPYDPEKHIWFVDRGSQQIFKFSNDGKRLVMTLGEKDVAGNDDKHFGRPTDIAFLPDGTFFVSDGYDNTRVVKFDKTGKFLTAWGTKGTGPGQFDLPHCIAVDARRRVYVADRSNHRIQIFDENGKFLDEWPNIPQPHHLMITQDQFLWLSDGTTSRIAKYDLNGKLLTYWGTQGTSAGYMNQPHAFSVDSEGSLYVANGLNQRVEKYTPKANAERARLVGQAFGPGGARDRRSSR